MKKSILTLLMLALMTSMLVTSAFAATDATKRVSINLVNQDPDPALAGEIVEIRLGISNAGGGAVEDLVVQLVPEYPFEMVPGENERRDIGLLKSFQTGDDLRIEKFRLRVDNDAIAGQYDLKIFEFENGSKSITQHTITLDVKNKESAEVIYIDQVELLPGKITPMTFTINNVGAAPLRDLTFKWENEDDIVLPVGSSDSRYIKYIEIGEKAELEYQVIASANADPDLYKLDLTLTYDDPLSNEEKVISATAGVYVGGDTDFDVAFSGSSKGESSFSISNIGNVPASSVTVRVPRQDGWRVTGTDSVIIGNLNEGDYTIASFALQQAGGGAGRDDAGALTPEERQERRGRFRQQRESAGPDETAVQERQQPSPLSIDIVYTDTRGERHTVTKEVMISAAAMNTDGTSSGQLAGRNRSASATSSLPSWQTIGMVVVMFLALMFLHGRYKKGKLKDVNYTYGKTVRDLFGGKGSKK